MPVENQQVGTRAWAFWLRNRGKLQAKFPMTTSEWNRLYPNKEDCPICHGAQEVRAGDGIVYQCMCLLMNWRDMQIEIRSKYQSKYEPASLDGLDYRKDEKNAYQLEDAVDAADHFCNYLDSWLVLSGGNGAGKSRIMRAIATMLEPICLFITATDFERKVFDAMDEEGNGLGNFIQIVSQAPVLLFDDLGSEYSKDFMRSQVAAVFIARDHQARDLPTVVTTNLQRYNLKMIPRVGSRLLNQDVVKFLPLELSDYRTRDYDKAHPERSNVVGLNGRPIS
jgi:DNA replication protein DnaC